MSKLHHAKGDEHHVIWWCPGCLDVHSIPVTGAKAWRWNGSEDAPTFAPSVLVYEHPALDSDGMPIQTPRCHVFITDGVINFLSDCTHGLAGQQVPMVEWRGHDDAAYLDLNNDPVPYDAAPERPKAEAVATLIPQSQRDSWRALRGQGITSDVGEYTPKEFWTLLDAYEQVLAAIDANPDFQPIATIKRWIDAYTNPSNGPHFQGHGKMVEMLCEYLALRLALLDASASAAAGREATDTQRCESGCGPATTADSEGVPLCDKCAWDLDREVLGEIATLVGFDRGKHDDLVTAVRERMEITREMAVRAQEVIGDRARIAVDLPTVIAALTAALSSDGGAEG